MIVFVTAVAAWLVSFLSSDLGMAELALQGLQTIVPVVDVYK